MLSLVVAITLLAPPQKLTEARQLADEFKFDKALKAVDAALLLPELDRETLLALYELGGVVAANLDKPAKARDYFTLLLTVAPEHQLSKNLPPRTRTPYFEARSKVTSLGSLALSAGPATRVDGRVQTLTFTAHDSPVLAARAVRVRLELDGAAPITQTVKLDASKRAVIAAVGLRVKWVAELLGDRNAVLEVVSRDEQPAPPPKLVADLPPPPLPPAQVTAVTATTPGWLKPTGLVVGGLGVAALGVGAAFGVLSSNARSTIANAAKNDQGLVVGLSQASAASLGVTAVTDATIANGLLIGGAALTATGLVMTIVASVQGSAPPPVSMLIGPSGVAVAGRF
jgi:hypothetical protein